jgi:NitT/TauT family transport system ATP-binding protein
MGQQRHDPLRGKSAHEMENQGGRVVMEKTWGPGNMGKPSAGQLRIEEVTKIYAPERANVLALDHCSLRIGAGEFCVIVGPSGCGKTTLLNAIAGFHDITSGEIYLDDQLLCSGKKSTDPGADRIVVFQQGALFPWYTVLENVIYGPVVQGKMPAAEAKGSAEKLLGQMGLTGISHNYPNEISSGMRRRVEIARAMMNDPKVLLLDEPFRALDALTKSVMHKYLLDVYDSSQKTIFFITHDLEEAIFLGSRVVVMTTRPGRIKKIIEVDIPRPRDYRVLSSERYRELKMEAIEAVHEEARKAFEAGERELA